MELLYLKINTRVPYPLVWWPINSTNLLNNLGTIATDMGIVKPYYIKLHAVEPFYDSIPNSGDSSEIGSQSYYCLKFQQFYNKVTMTSYPITEDGIYGPKTATAYSTIGQLLNGTYSK